jgi:hypothetical protein
LGVQLATDAQLYRNPVRGEDFSGVFVGGGKLLIEESKRMGCGDEH